MFYMERAAVHSTTHTHTMLLRSSELESPIKSCVARHLHVWIWKPQQQHHLLDSAAAEAAVRTHAVRLWPTASVQPTLYAPSQPAPLEGFTIFHLFITRRECLFMGKVGHED